MDKVINKELIKGGHKVKFEIECVITHPDHWLFKENIQAALKQYFHSDSFKVTALGEDNEGTGN